MAEHTPNLGLPWYADPDQRVGCEWNVHIVERNDPYMRVCFMANSQHSPERAAHLVRSANAHDALVKALEEIESGSFAGASTFAVDGNWKFMYEVLQEIARAALTKVKS